MANEIRNHFIREVMSEIMAQQAAYGDWSKEPALAIIKTKRAGTDNKHLLEWLDELESWYIRKCYCPCTCLEGAKRT